MSKPHISNNSLTNLLFSAARQCHAETRNSRKYQLSKECRSSHLQSFQISTGCCSALCFTSLPHGSLLPYLQPSPLPTRSTFLSFLLPSALLTHFLSFFSLPNDLPFLTPAACFTDLILDLKKQKTKQLSRYFRQHVCHWQAEGRGERGMKKRKKTKEQTKKS